MRQFAFVTFSTLGFSVGFAGAVAAADMPVKAAPLSPPPPPLIYSWTGFYIGGNIGYGWGRGATDLSGTGTDQSFPPPSPPVTGSTTTIFFASSNKASLNGVIGGGQIGYNFQFAPQWVAGLEADIQGSGQRGNNTFTNPFSSPQCVIETGGVCTVFAPLSGSALTSLEAKINWFGTVRGRVGMLITDQALLYATAGFAYGNVEVSGTTSLNGSFAFAGGIPFAPTLVPFSATTTNVGFAVGAGLEAKFAGMLPPNWTWKIEYLHVDLGSVNTVNAFTAPFPAGVLVSPLRGSVSTGTHFTDDIVRFGVNYKL